MNWTKALNSDVLFFFNLKWESYQIRFSQINCWNLKTAKPVLKQRSLTFPVCWFLQSSPWTVWKRWISPAPNCRAISPWGALVLRIWRRLSPSQTPSSNHLWKRRATDTWTSSQSPRWGTARPAGRNATPMTASRTPSPAWSSFTAWPHCCPRATIQIREVCGNKTYSDFFQSVESIKRLICCCF